MGKHYKKEVYDKIDELLKQGVGNKKITEILDVSIGAVTHRKEKLGLNKRRPPKLTHEKEMEIIHLRKTTSLSQEEIGKVVGVGHSTVSRVCVPYFKAEKEEQDRKIVEMSKQGYYAHEIADVLGISPNVVSYRRRLKLGVSGDEVFCVRYAKMAEENQRLKEQQAKEKEQFEKEEYERRLAEAKQIISDNIGDDWEYDSGFVALKYEMKIRCKHCGNIVTLTADALRQWRNHPEYNHGKHLICDVCESVREGLESCLTDLQDACEQYEIDSLAEHEFGNGVKTLRECPICGTVFYGSTKCCCNSCAIDYTNRISEFRFESKKAVCRYCGKEFMTTFKESKVFCSKECAKRHAHSQVRMRKRLRKHRINDSMIDSDITLGKLIKRDNHICKICGKPVDENDYYIDDVGNFIVGHDYPSIDHIKPISKGGTHSWDNIQLAHHYCNTVKNDNYTP